LLRKTAKDVTKTFYLPLRVYHCSFEMNEHYTYIPSVAHLGYP